MVFGEFYKIFNFELNSKTSNFKETFWINEINLQNKLVPIIELNYEHNQRKYT